MQYFKKKDKTKYEIITDRIISATPLICLIIYLFLGFEKQLWHPGWVIFLAIPVVPLILKPKGFKAAYPLFVLIIYLLLGFFINWWHPGWIIFLTIPVFYILFPEKPQIIITNDKDDSIDAEFD